MKKFLLLSAGAMLATSTAFAVEIEPQEYPNLVFSAISPNGTWAASSNSLFYEVAIVNLETNQCWGYGETFGNEEYFDGGLGHSISNDGIFVANTSNGDELPMYWEKGEWHELPVQNSDYAGFPNAITPDGSRIVGNVMRSAMDLDAEIVMAVPVIWNRNADGTYDDYIELPYPTADFTGRLPQYVLANDVNAEGNIIAGNLRDYSGFTSQPIYFVENEDGSWEYKMLHPELLNPNGIELPEFPTEEPEMPNPTDYMTQAEIEAYEAAVAEKESKPYPQFVDFMTEEEIAAYKAAEDAFYEDPQNNPYPYATSFMTDEEIDAYNAAVDEYWTEIDPSDYMNEEEKSQYFAAVEAAEIAISEYYEKLSAYYEVFNSIIDDPDAISFQMNSSHISPNGKYMIMTSEKMVEDGSWWGYTTVCAPMLFDLEDDSYKLMDKGQSDILGTMVNDNATVLGASPSNTVIRDAFIAEGPDADFLPLLDYIKAKDAALGEWIVKNMTHTYTTYDYEYDPETDSYEEKITSEDHTYLGTPVATDDLSIVATWVYNAWSEDFNDPFYYSYILPIEQTTDGIKNVVNNAASIALNVNNGIININGAAKNVTVYDLNGRTVFTLDAPSATVATGLAKGAYIIKATSANGTVTTKKAIF